MHAIGDQVTES